MNAAVTLGVDLVDRVHAEVVARGSADETPDEARVRQLVRAHAPLIEPALESSTVEAVLARVQGLGPLEPLLDDPAVTEVMVNGGGHVWVERGGALVDTGVVVDESTALRLIERIVAPLGLRIDRSSPMVDARLVDGSRVNAVVHPLAVDGPCLTIRRFGSKALSLDAFADSDVAALLRAAVAERRNVVVSGGTGSGKTTLLNALAGQIPDQERVLTIEDAAELRLPGRHVVRLEARPANADGLGAVSVRDLVRNALRMRPDRIVVGEVRGAEALDMLQAMNTGHDGSLSTCHANGPDDALRRLETLCLLAGLELPLAAVRDQLLGAVDLVVQVARRPDGGRRIVAVGEPVRHDGTVRCRAVVRQGTIVAPIKRPGRTC